MSHEAKKTTEFTQGTFLPFVRPSISQEAIDDVVACLKSGWITTGPRVAQFEENLKTYLGAPHVLTVSSATAGLHLALLTLKLQPGDEVIAPSMTFVATANMIVQAGGIPVFVDVDMDCNLNLDFVEQAITPKTKAIMPVHFAGKPLDLDRLDQIAEKHSLRVIEDAAHAIGASYKGQKIGSRGDIQVFSFHPNKNMTTGEGGCIATRDKEVAHEISLLRFHGIDREAWNRFGKKGSQHYEVVCPGFKYNMMDIQAALGIHQLNALDSFNEKRAQLVKRYLKLVGDWPEFEWPTLPDESVGHTWHLFAPLINEKIAGMNREQFMEAMKQEDIGTGLHFNPVHLYPFYRETYGYKAGDLPVTETIGQRIVSLPLFPNMQEADQDRVIQAMKKVLNKNK